MHQRTTLSRFATDIKEDRKSLVTIYTWRYPSCKRELTEKKALIVSLKIQKSTVETSVALLKTTESEPTHRTQQLFHF